MSQAGISYEDIIELNFTLTVDRNESRMVGSGVELSTIILSPICARPLESPMAEVYEGGISGVTQCGSQTAAAFQSVAPGQ